jgi:hypothetical protein
VGVLALSRGVKEMTVRVNQSVERGMRISRWDVARNREERKKEKKREGVGYRVKWVRGREGGEERRKREWDLSPAGKNEGNEKGKWGVWEREKEREGEKKENREEEERKGRGRKFWLWAQFGFSVIGLVLFFACL